MPDVPDGPRLPLERFAAVYEYASPLASYAVGGLSPAMAAIGQGIARLIRPGDTLQLGLGKVQAGYWQHCTRIAI